MPIVNLKTLLDHAAEYSYAIPAFNINCYEQCAAIVEAAAKSDAPAILQVSALSRDFLKDSVFKHFVSGLAEEYPYVPICVHLDHAFNVEDCISAIQQNYTSVMMDGTLIDGKTQRSFEENILITKQAVSYAHERKISVEGALGIVGSIQSCIATKEDAYQPEGDLTKENLLTSPAAAVEFVKETNIDALAIAVGSTHGAFKFKQKPDENSLELSLMREIYKLLPNTHFVLHGGSAVPQYLQDMINENGGEIEQTWGIPDSAIIAGTQYGLRKVNIDTDGRLAITGQLRKTLKNPVIRDPRKYLQAAKDGIIELCCQKYELFGAAGRIGFGV